MSSHKPVADQALAGYQLWELEHLEDHVTAHLPTAAEVEKIIASVQMQAHKEGYDAGLKEGRATGYQQGDAQVKAETARLQADAIHLQSLMVVVEESMQQLQHTLGQELLAVALDVAKQMLRQSLRVKPELVLPVVRGAMESIPQHAQHPHLHLHPEDAALVKTLLQAELASSNWRVIEDARIERGGCRIETSTSTLDATLPARWQGIANALAQDMSWLDE